MWWPPSSSPWLLWCRRWPCACGGGCLLLIVVKAIDCFLGIPPITHLLTFDLCSTGHRRTWLGDGELSMLAYPNATSLDLSSIPLLTGTPLGSNGGVVAMSID